MLPSKKVTRYSLLTASLVLIVCVTGSAQTESRLTVPSSQQNHAQQDSETLKALEIANIRLSAANETIKLLNDRLAAKDAVIEAREAKIALRDEQLALAQSANKDRATVNTGDTKMLDADAKILAACEGQLAKADARIWSLEHPGLLRSLFSTDTLAKFGAGFFAGSAINKK